MKTVGAFEAKTYLPQLLNEVEAGETIAITKYGRPIAIIKSIAQEDTAIHQAINALKNNRKGIA